MKNKIIFLIVFVVLTSVIFYGCSGESDNKNDININKDETKITNEGGNVTISNSLNNSVEVPEDFPTDLIPIYENGTVFGVSEQQDGYAIAILTNDNVKEVAEYYNSAVKDANILMCNEGEDYYEITGSLGDYTFSITASENTESDDFKTSIGLVAFPGTIPSLGMGDMGNINADGSVTAEDSKISDDYEIADGVVIPEDYSSDDVPIYGGTDSKLCFTMDKDPAGNDVVVLGYVSKYTPEEVIDYYQNKYENAVVKDIPKGKEISGSVNGKDFNIAVQENDTTITKTDSSFKSMVSINIR